MSTVLRIRVIFEFAQRLCDRQSQIMHDRYWLPLISKTCRLCDDGKYLWSYVVPSHYNWMVFFDNVHNFLPKELAANQLDLDRSNSDILYEKAAQFVDDVQPL